MRATLFFATITTLFMSASAYAQTQLDVHIAKPDPAPKALAPEVKAERPTAEQRVEMKAKWEKMTPEERKAFRAERQKKMQARLDAMTPEEREKYMEKRRQRRAQRQQEGK